MPLFMFLSGYVSYKIRYQNNFIVNRFKQLIIPFITWGIISSLTNCNFSLPFQLILFPDKGLWFLWVLFFINIVPYISSLLTNRFKISYDFLIILITAFSVLCMIIFKYRYLGFQFFSWYLPFFYRGIINF